MSPVYSVMSNEEGDHSPQSLMNRPFRRMQSAAPAHSIMTAIMYRVDMVEMNSFLQKCKSQGTKQYDHGRKCGGKNNGGGIVITMVAFV
jgi:hypothetical protein